MSAGAASRHAEVLGHKSRTFAAQLKLLPAALAMVWRAARGQGAKGRSSAIAHRCQSLGSRHDSA